MPFLRRRPGEMVYRRWLSSLDAEISHGSVSRVGIGPIYSGGNDLHVRKWRIDPVVNAINAAQGRYRAGIFLSASEMDRFDLLIIVRENPSPETVLLYCNRKSGMNSRIASYPIRAGRVRPHSPQRVFVLARKKIERLFREVPYPMAVRIFLGSARWRPLRHIMGVSELIRFSETCLSPARLDKTGILRRCLLTSYLGVSRLKALVRSNWPDTTSTWFIVKGLENLLTAHARHRAVVLVNSHYGAAQCVPLLVARLGFRLHSIECCNPFAALGLEQTPRLTVIPTSNSFLGRVAVQARRGLEADGMICVAADGYVGHSGITLPFHGRARRFASSFAELAVGASAAVVPLVAGLDDEGRATLEISEPWEEGDAAIGHAQRVRSLIKRYAHWVERLWTKDPGNVINFENFTALPPWPHERCRTNSGDGNFEL